jgi:hypothetical protein
MRGAMATLQTINDRPVACPAQIYVDGDTWSP